ncbi:DUF6221 family protein [Streptomyces sp. NPDC047085]|uniref:DUF6221 family protein n=1 Tax=Streptomyces sp. NPDC047085 TaxID=3155140 RepID=UPI0033D41E91
MDRQSWETAVSLERAAGTVTFGVRCLDARPGRQRSVAPASASSAGALRVLAQSYAEHPDYRAEWRP